MLTSTVCRYEHFETDWFRRWQGFYLNGINADLWQRDETDFHRKHWELAAVTQALYERGLLGAGNRGVGFAVGGEPLASMFAAYGVDVLATDLDTRDPRAQAWVEGGQHADNLENLYKDFIVDRESFDRHVRFGYADMGGSWDLPAGSFDFVWSTCSFEHLGSLEAGLDFVVRSSELLRPGGVAVHTTEYNVSSDEATLTKGGTVLYRRRDIEALDLRLRRLSKCLARPDYWAGDHPNDRLFDYPPFYQHPGRNHIKLLLDDYVATSFLVIVLG